MAIALKVIQRGIRLKGEALQLLIHRLQLSKPGFRDSVMIYLPVSKLFCVKKNLYPFIYTLCISVAIWSCGSGNDTKNNDGKESGKDVSRKGMTVAEATAFLEADVANSGKEITVSAISWGSNNRIGGQVQLNLGDKKLEGMASASFSCIFEKDQAAAIQAIAKDATVTISGKIAKGAGGIELTECKLLQ